MPFWMQAFALPGLACLEPSDRYPTGRIGTNAGYHAHKAANEPACTACQDAHRVNQTKTRRRRGTGQAEPGAAPRCATPTKKYPEGRTGTAAGYLAHYYYNEAPCEQCTDGLASAAAAYKAADPERSLRTNLRYKYQLSVEEYRAMLARQGNRCAICGVDSPTDVRTDRFHVDHDHACCPGSRSCGMCTRGLLCHACNTALGNFKDSREILRAALRYLSSNGVGDDRE